MKRNPLLLFFLLSVCCLSSVGQNNFLPKPVVKTAVYSDMTAPLRDMEIVLRGTRDRTWKDGIIGNRSRNEADQYQARTPLPVDIARQSQKGEQKHKGPGRNFSGIGKGTSSPSDSDGDVGPNHYFQMVNLSFAIWDKQGNLLYGPVDNSTLWDGFIGPWTGTNDGDPIVLYDDLSDRWIATQFAVDTDDGTFWQLIAVSASEDPLDAYYRYAFQFEDFNDYPKFSVWPDGYYSTYNMFDNDFEGAIVAVMDRDAMIVGDPDAQIVMFGPFSEQYSVKPAHLEGPLPPDGGPNWMVNLKKYGQQSIEVYKFNVDWDNPLNSTNTMQNDLVVTPFDFFNPGEREQLPQPNTDQLLDPLSKYLMNPLQYRNFGSYESMVVNHTVKIGDVAGIRWYELRKHDGQENWFLYQEGTYCPEDGLSRWMGSIAMNANGDIALGYSVTGDSKFPSVAYTGRTSESPLGVMDMEEIIVVDGVHSQTNSARWGDYSALAIDPVDDVTFWYTSQYMPSGNWGTRIISFDFGPLQPPTAYAGPDGFVCYQQVYDAHGIASGQDSVSWTSSGDGNMFNGNTLNPSYIRGRDDLEKGWFELIMTVYGFDQSMQASDTVHVDIIEDVSVSLGNDTTILIGNSIQLNPHIINADSLAWYSSGDGVFSNDTIANPFYTPGVMDNENGEVILSLDAFAFPPCEGDDNDDLKVVIDGVNNISVLNETPFLHIYPNPSDGIVKVQVKGFSGNDGILNVVNEAGKMVFRENLNVYSGKYENSINFSYLPDGVYFISLDTKNGNIIKKIILEK